MSRHAGIGASVLRKEDERFLRGRGQYVADFRIPGTRDVAFVRSPVAHARIRAVHVPDAHKASGIHRRKIMTGVKPIRVGDRDAAASSIPASRSWRRARCATSARSSPMCVAPRRAEAEDIAAAVEVDYEELPAVVDMLAARKPGAPLVHEEWGDNVFIEFFAGRRGHRRGRQPRRHQGDARDPHRAPMHVPDRGARRRRLLGRAPALSHRRQRDADAAHRADAASPNASALPDGAVRVISPDVGGGFGYKGLLLPRGGGARLARPRSWASRCAGWRTAASISPPTPIAASTTTASPAMPTRRPAARRSIARRSVDAGAYSVYPTSSALEAAQVASLLPGPYDFSVYRCRSAAVATNKCPILPYRGVARTGVCLRHRGDHGCDRARSRRSSPTRCACAISCSRSRCRSTTWSRSRSTAATIRSALRRAVAAIEVAGRARAAAARRAGRPADRRRGLDLLRAGRDGHRRAVELGPAGRARPRAGASCGSPPTATLKSASARIRTARATRRHSRRSRTRCSASSSTASRCCRATRCTARSRPATWGSRGDRHGRRRGRRGVAGARATRQAGIGAWLLQADPSRGDACGRQRASARAAASRCAEIARAWYLQPQHLPPDVDTGGLEVTAGYRADARRRHLQLCDACRGRRGRSRDRRRSRFWTTWSCEDGGMLVNPMIVDGQICGGTAQGIGTCLYEAMPFDAQRPAARLDPARLHAARRDRGARHPRAAHGDAVAAYRVRRQGYRRRRRRRPACGNRLGRQRRAARRWASRCTTCR